MQLWAAERAQRIAHEQRPSVRAFDIDVTEIEEGLVLHEQGVRIRAVAVPHHPVPYAFGFVFEADGQRAVFSGDTARSTALIAAARGADVLVHECLIHRELHVLPGVRNAATVANVAAYLTLSSEVGGIAREAGVGLLMLNHFVPARFDRTALLAEVRESWTGPLVIGEDLMHYEIGTRTLSYADAQLSFAT